MYIRRRWRLPERRLKPVLTATAAARATEANREFVAIAHDYSWLPEGTKARYFAGITYEDMGQNSNAETELKAAAGSWDRNVANLAKLALAGLYRQTSRDNDAIALYNEIIAKPSATVSDKRGAAGPGRSLCRRGQAGPGARTVGQGEGCGQERRGGVDRLREAGGQVGSRSTGRTGCSRGLSGRVALGAASIRSVR